MKPKILVLTLGGTIAMTQEAAGRDAPPGVKPSLTGEMLVQAVPQLAEVATIEVNSFRQLPGVHLTFADLDGVAKAIEKAMADGTAGVVVVQGTDTLEETAFALDRLLEIEAPIVVTGAMRNPTTLGAEGAANLMAAVQVAASDVARGLGCIVVMNDEIHAARFVAKTHTSSVASFRSLNTGPLGWIVEGRVRILTTVSRIACVAPSVTVKNDTASESRVAILTAGISDDGLAVDLLSERFAGLVIEATGGGHVSPGMANALERAARRIPVILASRAQSGETLSATYGFVGGEIDLQHRGLIRAGWLDGVKARVLLSLLLRNGHRDVARIANGFEAWGGG